MGWKTVCKSKKDGNCGKKRNWWQIFVASVLSVLPHDLLLCERVVNGATCKCKLIRFGINSDLVGESKLKVDMCEKRKATASVTSLLASTFLNQMFHPHFIQEIYACDKLGVKVSFFTLSQNMVYMMKSRRTRRQLILYSRTTPALLSQDGPQSTHKYTYLQS